MTIHNRLSLATGILIAGAIASPTLAGEPQAHIAHSDAQRDTNEAQDLPMSSGAALNWLRRQIIYLPWQDSLRDPLIDSTYDNRGITHERRIVSEPWALGIRSFHRRALWNRFARGYIYDMSIAAIALAMGEKKSDLRVAHGLINGLVYLQSEHGGLGFSANLFGDRFYDETYERSGSEGWAGYATLFVAARRKGKDLYSLTRSDIPSAHLVFVKRLAERLLKRCERLNRDGPQNDKRAENPCNYGKAALIRGGRGAYAFSRIGADNGDGASWCDEEEGNIDTRSGGRYPTENFCPDEVNWFSVEHNIDNFFFLHALGSALGSEGGRYTNGAVSIEKGLEHAWRSPPATRPADCDDSKPCSDVPVTCLPKTERFARGLIDKNGRKWDWVPALDLASWGAMYQQAIEECDNANKALEWAECFTATYRKEKKDKATEEDKDQAEEIKGYRPYRGRDDYGQDWDRLRRVVWTEGSLGVAMAQYKAGNSAKARQIVDEMLSARSKRDAMRYALHSTEWNLIDFIDAPSVAGTAWLAMVLRCLEPHQEGQVGLADQLRDQPCDDFWSIRSEFLRSPRHSDPGLDGLRFAP